MVSALFSVTLFLTTTLPQAVSPDDQTIALNGYPRASATVRTHDEHAMFEALNLDRRLAGLAPLARNSKLDAVARQHARDMIMRQYFGHDTPDGESPFDRLRRAGVTFGYAGENLAMNADPERAESAFMHSAPHRANILEPHYRLVGIAASGDPVQGEIFVQEFVD
jgi:uncharacterized protein YkwD